MRLKTHRCGLSAAAAFPSQRGFSCRTNSSSCPKRGTNPRGPDYCPEATEWHFYVPFSQGAAVSDQDGAVCAQQPTLETGMNVHSQLIVSFFLLGLFVWILRGFSQRRLSSGQTLFLGSVLLSAELCTLSPRLVDRVSVLWGNLVPVSWISFVGLLLLIVYLLHVSMHLNRMESRFTQLTRTITFLEERIRNETGQTKNDGTDNQD